MSAKIDFMEVVLRLAMNHDRLPVEWLERCSFSERIRMTALRDMSERVKLSDFA